jgi:hypothetical protein
MPVTESATTDSCAARKAGKLLIAGRPQAPGAAGFAVPGPGVAGSHRNRVLPKGIAFRGDSGYLKYTVSDAGRNYHRSQGERTVGKASFTGFSTHPGRPRPPGVRPPRAVASALPSSRDQAHPTRTARDSLPLAGEIRASADRSRVPAKRAPVGGLAPFWVPGYLPDSRPCVRSDRGWGGANVRGILPELERPVPM